LTTALRQLYEHSWRLLLLNVVLASVALAAGVAVVAVAAPALLVLLVLVGPFLAAFMHCAVTLRQTGELRLADGVVGLRLHWQRGLALGVLAAAAVVLVIVAVSFWSGRGAIAWPLAVLAIYVAGMFAVWQIHLWPLAVARTGTSFGEVLREAGAALARRPIASCALAGTLLLVNAVGAIGVLPVLTFTIAYSALAAAHFALPEPEPLEEVSTGWPASPSTM
jgi:hypothetical protein